MVDSKWVVRECPGGGGGGGGGSVSIFLVQILHPLKSHTIGTVLHYITCVTPILTARPD